MIYIRLIEIQRKTIIIHRVNLPILNLNPILKSLKNLKSFFIQLWFIFLIIINFYYLIQFVLYNSITVIVNYSFLRAYCYFITLIYNASSLRRYRRVRCSSFDCCSNFSSCHWLYCHSGVFSESSCNENSSFIMTLRVPLLLNEIFLLRFSRRLARAKDQTMLCSLCSRHRLVY